MSLLQQNQAQILEDRLANLETKPPIPGKVVRSSNIQGLYTPAEDTENSDDPTSLSSETDSPLPVDSEAEESTEVQDEASEETGEETEGTEFEQAFSAFFGISPEEAISTFNELRGFRDEVTLMSEWNLNPGEYRERMGQVREFYNTLPEDSREKFNTADGAKVIWEHLSKQQGTPKKTAKPAGVSKKQNKPAKPIFTEQQIVSMPKAEYQQKLPEIRLAYQEGRVLAK